MSLHMIVPNKTIHKQEIKLVIALTNIGSVEFQHYTVLTYAIHILCHDP